MFLCIFPYACFANWAIGGEMTYECLGETTPQGLRKYKISLTYYIECNSPVGGNSFSITYYRGSELLLPFPTVYLDSVEVQQDPEFPCLVPPPVPCVEKRLYSTEIELPVIDSSYYFTFQTCCRNDELININLNNMETQGYTIFIEITPAAQAVCNSSPTFQGLPPSIICKDEVMEFNHTAIDIDGDQLVYRLYGPFGWNSNGTFNIMSPPPYPSVSFYLPVYSIFEPLGSTSIFIIDPITGFLEVIPNEVGQFIIGLSVQEYRNGQLLSTVYRDFQQNVIECDRQVVAKIEADSITNNGTYILNVCNSYSTKINNLSVDTGLIDEFVWRFNIENDIIEYTEWNPEITFPKDDSFIGQLLLNPGDNCPDTAKLIVNVSGEVVSDYTFNYDTCIGGPIQFNNESYSSGNQIKEWIWNFGNGLTSITANPLHRYETPGEFNISLKIIDEHNCQDSIEKIINWQPAPPIIVVSPDFAEGCAPLSTTFSNLSWPIDSTYDVHWDFGDTTFSSDYVPIHIYTRQGFYPVFVSITSPLGCYIDTTFYNLIKVEDPPSANFNWLPDLVSSFDPEARIYNTSERDIGWKWSINNEDISFQENFDHVFADTGMYEVSLLIEDQYGCQDSIVKVIDVIPKTTYFLPNAFTPNQDGKNELFTGAGVFEGITKFNLSIWDRWGNVVFTTNDINEGWDGKNSKTGKKMPNGVYVCLVKYLEPRNNLIKIKKTIVLIR